MRLKTRIKPHMLLTSYGVTVLIYIFCFILFVQTNVIQVMETENTKKKWRKQGEVDYNTFYPEDLLEFFELMNAKIVSVLILNYLRLLKPFFFLQIFIPTVHNDHWWCYAFVWGTRELYVLDSIGHTNRHRYRKAIDLAVVMCYLFSEITWF